MDAQPVILLVDDEPLNLDYLQQELEDVNCAIMVASSGPAALQIASEHPLDMIFLDIMMPGMDGFEVLQRLKAEPRWKSIPVVIISAASDMSSIVHGIELGAEDFLPKPFEPAILHARLKAGLEKKRLRDIEQNYLRSLERELEIGREIQAGFLPRELPSLPGWEIEAFFRPAREVAGDFYDVFILNDSHLVFMLGDVTDKGVGSALFMALYRSLLRALITLVDSSQPGKEHELPSPEHSLRMAVNQVNLYITSVHESSMLATIFLGALDLRSGELCYLNAGHDQPYLLRSGRIQSMLEPTGPLVGAIEGVNYSTRGLSLQPGDTLVVYSDGVTDALNPQGQMFTRERWQNLLDQPDHQERLHASQLARQVFEFTGEAAQYDDISLLVLSRLPAGTGA